MVRMESRDGEHTTWLDEIVRDGDNVTLGKAMMVDRDQCLNLESYFGS